MRTNAVPATIEDLNNIPVKFANGATVLLKDLGYVRDGSLVQQNVVRADGRRSVLLSVIKNGNASTVDVVREVKKALKVARASAPPGMEIKELFDQSVFVSASVDSVLREGAIRGRADGANDSLIPRLLAIDPGGDDLDPAIRSVIADRALFPRRYSQHDDIGRLGAGHRYPRR